MQSFDMRMTQSRFVKCAISLIWWYPIMCFTAWEPCSIFYSHVYLYSTFQTTGVDFSKIRAETDCLNMDDYWLSNLSPIHWAPCYVNVLAVSYNKFEVTMIYNDNNLTRSDTAVLSGPQNKYPYKDFRIIIFCQNTKQNLRTSTILYQHHESTTKTKGVKYSHKKVWLWVATVTSLKRSQERSDWMIYDRSRICFP